MAPIRTLILGAAGRDFHNFNTFFRDNPAYEVVAFTATQIPNIADRRYQPVLAGPRCAGAAIRGGRAPAGGGGAPPVPARPPRPPGRAAVRHLRGPRGARRHDR